MRVSVFVVHRVSILETAQHLARISGDHAMVELRGENANREGSPVYNPWV